MMTLLRTIRTDSEGVTVVEFGLLAPVLLLTLLGLFDMGHMMYTKSLMLGAIQKAARDSSIEGAYSREAALDARVTEVVRDIAPDAVLTFKRRSYTNFSDVGQPEDFTDSDGDGTCNDGEPYEDANGNGTWDANGSGSEGFGGARDAVLYTVTVSYERYFPAWKLMGADDRATMQASTVLRNQPYDLQQVPAVEACA